MAFEMTFICDGCSTVWDGGTTAELVDELKTQEGRAFRRLNRGDPLEEMAPDDDNWHRSQRHLAPCCVDATKFCDGEPVPTPSESSGGTK